MSRALTERTDSPTHDTVLNGRVRLEQPRHGLRAGHDALLLAAAVPLAPTRAELLLDVGTGSGVVALCALARAPKLSAIGIDIQPPLIATARRNAEHNEWRNRARFEVGDATRISITMAALSLQPNSFDHVCANPPFHNEGTVQRAAHAMKDQSNVHPRGALDHWIRFMVQAVRPGGTVTLIHRAEALTEVLSCLERRIGQIIIRPVQPHVTAFAHRIIVTGVKGARAPVSIMRPLVLHQADGGPTRETAAVLRDGAPLQMKPGA